MYSTKPIKSSRRWPHWLKNDIVKNKSIDKAFASIGLKNCRGRAKIKIAEIPGSKFRVVFSYNPWDIATMSMRGITSCQNWASEHKYRLIGSVVDPYAAVIYITDGKKTKYGERMLVRSVVRITVNPNDRYYDYMYDEHQSIRDCRKVIAIELPYLDKTSLRIPDNRIDYNGEYEDAQAKYFAIFRSFLRNKLRTKEISVDDAYTQYNKNYSHIPLSEVVNKLTFNKRSYIDSDLYYSDDVLTR